LSQGCAGGKLQRDKGSQPETQKPECQYKVAGVWLGGGGQKVPTCEREGLGRSKWTGRDKLPWEKKKVGSPIDILLSSRGRGESDSETLEEGYVRRGNGQNGCLKRGGSHRPSRKILLRLGKFVAASFL